jgi:putative ABC transport system permease protein
LPIERRRFSGLGVAIDNRQSNIGNWRQTMSIWRSLTGGLRTLFHKERVEQEMDEELHSYLDAAVKEKMRSGMSRDQALRAARVEMGSMDGVKEEIRDAGWESTLETFWQDVRYGLRQLQRNPGFTAVVVMTLALGIGANTAVFSVLNGLFLRALPVPEPEHVVAFSSSNSWPEYLTYRDQAKSFESLSTSFGLPFTANLSSTRPPQHIYGVLVTGNFLTTLGIKPALGRGFLPDEDQIPSPKPVVMLSYELWRSRLGGDRDILGKAIRLNNASYTIVGVLPSGFRTLELGIAPDLWAPMAALPLLNATEQSMAHPFTNPDEQSFSIFGRLKGGVSRPQAQAEVNTINERVRQAAGKKERQLVSLETAGVLPGELGKMFLGVSSVAMVTAGLVLLLACVNVANLLSARGTSRRREVAIRLAIGAGRGRVIRQLMVGNVILSFLGAAAGLLLAYAATKAMASVDLPLALPIVLDFSPDLRVLLATAGIALLTSLLFGLAPAARCTRVDVNASLKDGDTASTGFAARWTRSGLVMLQVAVSVVVLVAATLFLHSLRNGFSIDLGFRPENLLVIRVDTSAQGYSPKRSALFFQQLEEQVSKLPAVRSASEVAPLPLGIFSSGRDFTVPGTSRTINANLHMVGPRYFETMEIPLIQGRDFRDIPASSPLVAVISRTMAEKLFPNENPIGQQIAWKFAKEKKTYEVIGVAGDTKSKTIGEPVGPCLYELAAQNEKDVEAFSAFGGVSLVVKTVGKPQALVAEVRQEVERLDPAMPVYGVETMEEQVGKSLVVARLAAWFLGAFGFLALTLAAVGLYGLMSYSVAARTREIAIRMALGASTERTLSLLARQGLSIVGVGLAAGLAASIVVGRVVSSLLYGVGSFDTPTFIAVPIGLVCVTCFAILVPARRATKVDPMVALRYE